MDELKNDKSLKRIAEQYGEEKVEEAFQKYQKIFFSKKLDNILSFFVIITAYLLSLASIKYELIIFGTEMLSFISLSIITVFVIDKIMFDKVLKMPFFPIVIAFALINIIVLELLTGDFIQGILILVVIVLKKFYYTNL